MGEALTFGNTALSSIDGDRPYHNTTYLHIELKQIERV